MSVSIAVLGKGKEAARYLIRTVPSDWQGQAFQFTKANGNTYEVFVGTNEECTCDCFGFQRHRHCKHLDHARKLTCQPVHQSEEVR